MVTVLYGNAPFSASQRVHSPTTAHSCQDTLPLTDDGYFEPLLYMHVACYSTPATTPTPFPALREMGKKQVLVGYGLDVDAVANHINTTKGGPPNLTNVSRGISFLHPNIDLAF